MNRRKFIRHSTAATAVVCGSRLLSPLHAFGEEAMPVQLKIHNGVSRGSIPEDFIGLGYEISSVARPGLLSGTNRVYTELVRTLGSQGVVRVGGNTADYSSYAADGESVSATKATIVNRRNFEELGSFLDATGWKLIWGLNLGRGTVEEAVEEAVSVSSAVKDKLLAFEIGNEVDLFSHEGHRRPGYTFAQYLEEYRRFKAAIRAKLPRAPFAGPDIAGSTDWVTQFAAAEGNDLVLLTHHYYRAGQSPASSFDMLLNPDTKLAPMLATVKQASVASKVPYRICETNSFSGGGKPGVSGTLGAALWVLEYMFHLASADAAGVNIETGVNHRGFISSYSPIGDDEHGMYVAKPEFYGMLAFAQGSRGQRMAVEAEPSAVNLTAYAVARDPKHVVVTIINKDKIKPAAVKLQCDQGRILQATALRLNGPALDSTTGIMLGGSPVTGEGKWKPMPAEALRVAAGSGSVLVPAASAAVVTLML